ncbi:MAG: D-aminoacyl-tRNA deacylase [Flavobacteriaceae bacterium]|nr:D-aminoacyl-tRNA deacylase [Flavobacteriaceae bacterium]
MRIVIQRVSEASVTIDGKIMASIGKGLLIFLGIETDDFMDDCDWLLKKILPMRIFPDENEVMNLSVQEVEGELLIISQFTLHASTKKGNRPSYIKAARPEQAIPLYEYFITQLENQHPKKVQSGIFGADMKVALINDGPVTILIDSKNRE